MDNNKHPEDAQDILELEIPADTADFPIAEQEAFPEPETPTERLSAPITQRLDTPITEDLGATRVFDPDEIAAQAEQSCKNVGAILEAAGSSFDKVFKTTCFLADMGDFAAFNEVYAKYFVSKPARSCVAVKTLPKGVLCEIEAIAVK